MRLLEKDVKIIKDSAQKYFGNGSEVYLFGSRVDDSKKGGDIDLYVVPLVDDNLYEKKIKFLVNLNFELGEQKIDIVIASKEKRLIDEVAIEEGILL